MKNLVSKLLSFKLLVLILLTVNFIYLIHLKGLIGSPFDPETRALPTGLYSSITRAAVSSAPSVNYSDSEDLANLTAEINEIRLNMDSLSHVVDEINDREFPDYDANFSMIDSAIRDLDSALFRVESDVKIIKINTGIR